MEKSTIAHHKTAAELAQRQNREHLEKVLRTPVFLGLSDQAEKVRRNVLVFALISIFSSDFGVELKQDAAILGFTFTGLTAEKVLFGLLLVTSFSLLHFIWLFADSFAEWRVRLTGTRLSLATAVKAGSRDGDYPEDPRQSTLYHWWSVEAEHMGNVSQHLHDFAGQLDELTKQLSHLPAGVQDLRNTQSALQGMSQNIDRMGDSVANLKRTIDSERPWASLARFDKWFCFFARSQNLRWLLLDVGTPLFLAAYALCALTRSIWP